MPRRLHRRAGHRRHDRGPPIAAIPARSRSPSDPDWLHAGRFGPRAAAPGRPPRRRDGGQALAAPALEHPDRAVPRRTAGASSSSAGRKTRPRPSVLRPHDRLRDWTGRLTVTQTTALLERADLFIGADSGPAHLAASAGTLSVILFSGTNQPGQWRPWSRHSLILRHRVPCQPCHQKVCPLADHPCMSGLDPDRVYRAARRWWARIHQAESPHNPM